MTEPQNTALKAGDLITATVTKSLPFGAFVEAPDGTPGLVEGLLNAAEGALLSAPPRMRGRHEVGPDRVGP